MLRSVVLNGAVAAGCFIWASTALAQFTQGNSGGSTGYGAFGNRTIGGGINTGSSGFSSGMGSSSMGSSGMGSSGYGNSTLGGSSMGGSSLGGNSNGLGTSPTQGFQLGSSLSSAQQRASAGFIGADNSDAANARSMQAMQQNQMNSLQNAFSQFGRQNQQRNQQNMNRNQGRQNEKQLRISISADIPLKSRASSPTSLGRQFETRLKKLPGLEKRNSIRVAMAGRTAILSGSVASEHDRKLAEGLALLEPGISAVQNDLVVAESATTGQELPPPRR